MKMNKNERISMCVFGGFVVILHLIFGILAQTAVEGFVNFTCALFWIGAIIYCFT